jgi:predicted acylesterase/phospholipase RssA
MFDRFTTTGPLERLAPAYPVALEGAHPDYPFENVVFQGGGAKGIIYAGCIFALDDLGILPYIKRVAAASAGCVPALFLALGLDGEQAEAETDELNLNEFFDGGKNVCGGVCKQAVLMFNVYKKLGMHPAEMVLTHFGKVLEKYTGDPDLTFKGLYNRSGRELCIAVSNVSRHQAELCHVNTTPDMPIRMAIRASMSLPILWEPCMLAEGETYVDGGLFSNFPLKAFDGWFLSTKKGDDILMKTLRKNPDLFKGKAQPDEVLHEYQDVMLTSFKEPNPATIGFRVTNDESPDDAAYAGWVKNMESRMRLERLNSGRTHDQEVKRELEFPNTRLANAYLKNKESAIDKIESLFKYEMAYAEMLKWMVCHAEVLSAQPVDDHPHAVYCSVITKQLKKTPPDCSYSLFGYFSWDEFTAALDHGKKGYITRMDISKF